MTDVVVDTNVILDLLVDDAAWFAWSASELAAAANQGDLILNQVVYAELAAGFHQRETLDVALQPWPFRRESLPWDAAFLAGKAFLEYRRYGGSRTVPLPDFFIGAHAAVRGHRLLTRDRKNYARYFPTIDIISPEAGA